VLDAGPLLHVDGNSSERQVLLMPREDKHFLVGWPSEVSEGLVEKTKKLIASWDS